MKHKRNTLTPRSRKVIDDTARCNDTIRASREGRRASLWTVTVRCDGEHVDVMPYTEHGRRVVILRPMPSNNDNRRDSRAKRIADRLAAKILARPVTVSRGALWWGGCRMPGFVYREGGR